MFGIINKEHLKTNCRYFSNSMIMESNMQKINSKQEEEAYEIDKDKQTYITLIQNLLSKAEQSFDFKDRKHLQEALNHLTFLSLSVKEMQLAKRTLNLQAHIFMIWK